MNHKHISAPNRVEKLQNYNNLTVLLPLWKKTGKNAEEHAFQSLVQLLRKVTINNFEFSDF